MSVKEAKGISMSSKNRTLLAKIKISAFIALTACAAAHADDVRDKDRILCSSSKVMLCVEDGLCFEISVLDADAPQFLIIDTKKKTVSTTEASGDKRESPVANMSRVDGRIFLQGVENNRAYSILIEEEFGRFSAAIARDGITVSAFGACTDADVS
jgi:hypothetical protein